MGKGSLNLKLGTVFSLVVFFISMSSVSILMFLTGLAYHFGFLNPMPPNPLQPLMSFAIIGVLSGTLLSFIVGHKVLAPILTFSEDSTRIAKGDFTVRCDESSFITEVSQVANNLNSMVRELSNIETLRSDFVANVSHEFKTPLASIEGYAMLLQGEELPQQERQEYLRRILDSTRRLSALSSNILSISRLEHQEIVTKQSRFRLDEQLRQCLLMLEPKWSEKQLELEIDLPEVWYFGSEELLQQVWLNLYSNAIKFTPPLGSIIVTVQQQEDQLAVTVADTGIGMEEEMQAHIFEKFYQGDTSHHSEGNGLGLALVQRILDLCHGTITAKSVPGEGAAFTVHLPVQETEEHHGAI